LGPRKRPQAFLEHVLTLHPATRLAAWIMLAAILPWLSPPALVSLAAVIVPACFWFRDVAWRRYLRRSSVLLLSMLLIYGLATPGHAMIPAWAAAPTYEGVEAGLLQVSRLVLLLLTLAMLLARMSPPQLLAGLYTLLRPLQALGLPIERLALRMWLTLHYADSVPATGPLHVRLDPIVVSRPAPETEFTLALPAFQLLDGVFLIGALAGVGWILA
jgi:energy-coupling factor transporter transmembrane protein EcfT